MSAPHLNSPCAPAELHAADGHRLLRILATRCEDHFRRVANEWLGYSKDALARRLTQKLLAETTTPFRRELKRRAAGHEDWNGIVQDRSLHLVDFKIDAATGATSIRFGASMKWVGVFAVYWVYLLVQAVLALKLKQPDAADGGTLLHGLGREHLTRDGNDSALLQFIRSGPIEPLQSARRLFAQAPHAVVATDNAWVTYARYPLVAVLRARGLTLPELGGFLVRHIGSAATYLRALLSTRVAAILARDFAFNAAASSLNEARAIDALVLTGSSYLEQMLWMSNLPGRTYRTHMVFYSVNGNPFVYKAHPVYENNTILSYIRVDDYWVWTAGQVESVRAWETGGEFHVVGPVLFYCPPEVPPSKRGVPQIAIFDVTPQSPAAIEKSGVIEPYYTTQNAISFIEGIVAARDAAAAQLGQPIMLALKPKRQYHRVHSTGYVDFLLDTAANDPNFRILDYQADLCALVAESDVVITMPYSSPPYVASRFGVPSIYFDGSDTLVPTHEPDPHIRFASTISSLTQEICRALAARTSTECRAIDASTGTGV